ncbi:hypothetical protein DSLASN_45710 [Desulfoluna limicola]|uniref:Uncharacterized protein n=1 Tax=Desulfoluna limicola TaxID=2810562 RepID=A0ABN6F996_9BACT|nr:hypothetical protein DSLASN_45710 [Desulfoluna limicola]
MHKPAAFVSGEARAEGPCALARGTRDKAQGQYAFEVAHLAAGGMLFPATLTIEGFKGSHENIASAQSAA